jgi:hypothetical protein
VRGSGQLHGKKFFPAALDCLQSNSPAVLIDIGCGDGAFLECICTRWPTLVTFGLDLSDTAVAIAHGRLARRTRREPLFVVANGREVSSWSISVPPELRDTDGLVISMWFVGHEFSAGSIDVMVRFFQDLNRAFPKAKILLGEINNIAPSDLAHNRDLSIMPEYLLFHELSGQGVLAWTDWQLILQQIPYRLEKECRFDDVTSASGATIPAQLPLAPQSLPQPGAISPSPFESPIAKTAGVLFHAPCSTCRLFALFSVGGGMEYPRGM